MILHARGPRSGGPMSLPLSPRSRVHFRGWLLRPTSSSPPRSPAAARSPATSGQSASTLAVPSRSPPVSMRRSERMAPRATSSARIRSCRRLHEPELEFFVELVPEGALTPLLFPLNVGDTVSLRKMAKGRFLIRISPQGRPITSSSARSPGSRRFSQPDPHAGPGLARGAIRRQSTPVSDPGSEPLV